MSALAGTFTPSNVNVAATSTSVLPANAARRYLLLVNNSDTTIYVDPNGGTASTSTGLPLFANGGYLELKGDEVPPGAITAIHGSSGTKSLRVVYGQ